ncbi:beta-lactamase family protein [Pseudenhygromyxa sp. WMMC2535]|uniref:serine hydrolase domain-containing protein n=1 Tax=Pseudenhygromyxa sp. WMMC2535 TaxID=2712867 RepID=UPI001556BD74|nr:serine hydrolase domain-containing protein [Pseudenhygromyxa sp. WMMC2535]NVB37974.1 beta-lactamase family protein [Pseudenhygromyxa sp. WMMC2535]
MSAARRPISRRSALVGLGTGAAAGAAGLLGCVHVDEQEPVQLRARALTAVAAGEVPAMVVATVHHGEIAVEQAGLAALAEGREISAESAFVWFSITKLFTATGIMQLHERGALDVDAPVEDLLGEEFSFRQPRHRRITARDLMSHSSGLGNPSVWALARPFDQPRPSTATLLALLSAAHGKTLRYRPGAGQHYSNLGFLALGRMIERADGRDYIDYVRAEILEVLGMARTDFGWTEATIAEGAVGHSAKRGFYTKLAKRVANPEVFGEPFEDWETTVPFIVDGASYGGLIGPASDLARFAAAHLGHGAWEGRRILTPASVHAMQVPREDIFGREIEHTMGWHTGLIDGERYYNHMGKGGGYRPALRIWPARDYGVVVMTNRTRYDPRPLTRTAPPR